MADDMLSREQRIRQEAQLNSLYTSLASYRKQETSYIETGAAIPEALSQQINEARHKIAQIEHQLFAQPAQNSGSQAREFYRQAFELELSDDLNKAIKLYKKAGRYGHADATTAIRSVQYRIKRSKRKAADTWMPIPASRARNRSVFGLAVLAIILLMIVAFVLSGRVPSGSQAAVVEAPTATPLPTVELIVPPTATPLPADTATSTPPSPTNTPLPTATEIASTNTPTPQPSPTPTLRAAPRIIEPKDGLVWGDGAVVFEFVDMDLAFDELYCLSPMRGFDIRNTENWSHPTQSNKLPYVAVEPNVFRVARAQGMRCVVWSAYIGKGSCSNPISEVTEERVIGLPQPCDFDDK